MLDQLFPKGRWANVDEFVIPCPYCPGGDHPTHSHCFLNPEKEVYHCFRCGASGSLHSLLRDVGVDDHVIEEMRRGAPNKDAFLSEPIKFDFMPIGTSGLFSERKAVEYLLSRNLTETDFQKYDIRYTNQGKYGGRVIFPIYESSRLVCFAARSVFKSVVPKYLYPSRGETMLTAGEAIFGYEGYSTNKVVLVEGIFDAIAVRKALDPSEFNVMAILGKTLSNYQAAKLSRLPSPTFYVMLDNDAGREAVALAKALYLLRRNNKLCIHLCFLSEKDPAETLPGTIRNAVYHSTERFSLSMGAQLQVEGCHVRQGHD